MTNKEYIVGTVIQLRPPTIKNKNLTQIRFVHDVREKFKNNLAILSLSESYLRLIESDEIDEADKQEHLNTLIVSLMKSVNIAGVESDDGYAILGGVLIEPAAFKLLKLIYQVAGKYGRAVSLDELRDHNKRCVPINKIEELLRGLGRRKFILETKLTRPAGSKLKILHYFPGMYSELYFDMEGLDYAE